MDVKNLLIVDDEKSPREIGFALEDRGYTVQLCEDLAMAAYYVLPDYINEVGKPFDALILDLQMDISLLPVELWQEARKTFAGWVFYEKILKECNLDLYKRTILYTAFGEQLKAKIGEARFSELRILSKTEDYLVRTADNMLKELAKIT